MRCSMTGTTTRTAARCRRRRGHGRFGVEPAVEHDRARDAQGEHRGAQSPAVEQRCRDDHCVPSPERDPLQQRDRSTSPTDPCRTAPRARPVVPEVRMTRRPGRVAARRAPRVGSDDRSSTTAREIVGTSIPATLAASSSSWISTSMRSPATTASISGAAKVGFRSTRSAPTFRTASVTMTNQRWFPQSRPTARPAPMSRSRSACGERVAPLPQLAVGDRARFVVDRYPIRIPRRRRRDRALDGAAPPPRRECRPHCPVGSLGSRRGSSDHRPCPELARDHG